MTNKSVFTAPLLSIFLLAMTFQGTPAHAGFLKGLCSWATGGTAEQKAMKQIKTKSEQQIREFRKARLQDKDSTPPVASLSRSTTSMDLIFGFHYWWFPGNIYNSVMNVEYASLGNTALDAAHDSGFQLPSIESVSSAIQEAVGITPREVAVSTENSSWLSTDIDADGIPDSMDSSFTDNTSFDSSPSSFD